MPKKNNKEEVIDCSKCVSQSDCCKFGAWIDLEEAKRIVRRGIKGDFFHLEEDKQFPCGYRVGTSYEDEACSFLDPDGLCRVHKIDYRLKPKTCKEFPYEAGKLSDFADVLCTPYKLRLKKNKKKRRGF